MPPFPSPPRTQNAFSEYDFNCPLAKSVGMLRCIVVLYERCMKAVTGSADGGRSQAAAEGVKTVTWNVVRAACGKVFHSVTELKFVPPNSSDSHFATVFTSTIDAINSAFDALAEQ